MKTTLDIPNDLYREVKALAALENCKVKDLVEEALRWAIQRRRTSQQPSGPLEVLEEIRKHPLHPPGTIAQRIETANQLRQEGWNRSDLNL